MLPLQLKKIRENTKAEHSFIVEYPILLNRILHIQLAPDFKCNFFRNTTEYPDSIQYYATY